jgi:hypothetical protein
MDREFINPHTIWNRTTDDWWFSIPEIADLLDSTYIVVKRHLKRLFQKGILKEHQVCKCVRLENGHSMDMYHMGAILALSFYVASAASHEFRENLFKWLVRKDSFRNQHFILLTSNGSSC